jgi:hypothetical protein
MAGSPEGRSVHRRRMDYNTPRDVADATLHFVMVVNRNILIMGDCMGDSFPDAFPQPSPFGYLQPSCYFKRCCLVICSTPIHVKEKATFFGSMQKRNENINYYIHVSGKNGYDKSAGAWDMP